jgi:hypothetical protein
VTVAGLAGLLMIGAPVSVKIAVDTGTPAGTHVEIAADWS